MELSKALEAIDKLEAEPKAQAKGLINAGYSAGMAYLAVSNPNVPAEQAAKMLKDTYPVQADGNQGGGAGGQGDATPAKERLDQLVAAHKAAAERSDVQKMVALKRQITAQRALVTG